MSREVRRESQPYWTCQLFGFDNALHAASLAQERSTAHNLPKCE